jgi:hypothetical protein
MEKFNIRSSFINISAKGKNTQVDLGILKLEQLLIYFAHKGKYPTVSSFK